MIGNVLRSAYCVIMLTSLSDIHGGDLHAIMQTGNVTDLDHCIIIL